MAKKHDSQRTNLEKQRMKEFEIIERRYNNVWNEMEGKFKKEVQQLERDSHVKKMNLKEQVKKARK